jgi:hypothetical protein
MWDPVSGLYIPTLKDFEELAKEKLKFSKVLWTEEDEMVFDEAIYELWMELLQNLRMWDKTDIFFDDVEHYTNTADEEEDEIECLEDFTINIDNIFEYELEDDQVFTLYDHLFYYITIYFLIFNGFFILSSIYLCFGEQMHLSEPQDDQEIIDAERALLVQAFAVKAYYIGIKEEEDLSKIDDDERIDLSSRILYCYTDVDPVNLYDMKLETILNYKNISEKFDKTVLSKINKKSCPNKFKFYENMQKKRFLLIIEQKKANWNSNRYLYLNDFDYDDFKSNIILSNSLNHLNNKIKICYLSI